MIKYFLPFHMNYKILWQTVYCCPFECFLIHSTSTSKKAKLNTIVGIFPYGVTNVCNHLSISILYFQSNQPCSKYTIIKQNILLCTSKVILSTCNKNVPVPDQEYYFFASSKQTQCGFANLWWTARTSCWFLEECFHQESYFWCTFLLVVSFLWCLWHSVRRQWCEYIS